VGVGQKSVDFVHRGHYILWLMNVIEQLEASGEVLSPAVRAALEGLLSTIAQLQERVRDLEARLAQNSTNSSQPPSMDPPGVVHPPKKPTGRKAGGQPGHPGSHRPSLPPERVDEVVTHRPTECANCKASLAQREAEGVQVHQVVEFPPVRAQVTEHRMESVRCPQCGEVTRVELPCGVGSKQFGPRLVALSATLSSRYRLSWRETGDLLGHLLDVPAPSLGSLQAFAQEASKAMKGVYEEVAQGVRESQAAGVDETPWRLKGKKQWLWVAVTEAATLFHLGAGRGAEELRRFLGNAFAGVVNSDRWCAYQIYPKRQVCWAHLPRNFRKLGLRGGEAARFGARGQVVCRQVFRLWHQMVGGSLDRAQLKAAMEPVKARFRRLLERGVTAVDRKVAGLCRNVLKLWPSLWTFLDQPVEPTNNAAERALRPAVLWRKGCFGSQSKDGLRFAERMLTLNATCRQRQIHPLDFLARAISAHRSGSPAPALITPT
jgi:transposase